MINEQDKQAILNGSFGVSRDGWKCKLVGITTSSNFKYFFVYFNKEGLVVSHNFLNENFNEYNDTKSKYDVIDLWKNSQEPFDLERALNGELVKYSDKPCYVYQSKVTGLFWVEAQDGSFVDNDTSLEALSEQGMWKDLEPVSNTVTLNLPCPLREPKEGMWFLGSDGRAVKSAYRKDNSDVSLWENAFNAGFYFGSEAEAQMWLDALRNNRR